MPSKLQFYSEFAERTARQITGSYRSWTAFLATAARLYKYPYNEQLILPAAENAPSAGGSFPCPTRRSHARSSPPTGARRWRREAAASQ